MAGRWLGGRVRPMEMVGEQLGGELLGVQWMDGGCLSQRHTQSPLLHHTHAQTRTLSVLVWEYRESEGEGGGESLHIHGAWVEFQYASPPHSELLQRAIVCVGGTLDTRDGFSRRGGSGHG